MIAASAATEGPLLFTSNPDDYRGLGTLVNVVAVPRPITRDS